jgi:hypothetical protein
MNKTGISLHLDSVCSGNDSSLFTHMRLPCASGGGKRSERASAQANRWKDIMAVYTVHEPPPQRYETASDPERFVFVRDGFSFWAFVLGPIWMLRHRMWLVLLGYVVTIAVLEGLLHLLNVSEAVTFTSGAFLALLVGFEAATLRRFTLARRRWRNVGIIVGDDLEIAERRFFDTWTKAEPFAPLHPPVQRTAAPSDVIGLFPEPGAPR